MCAIRGWVPIRKIKLFFFFLYHLSSPHLTQLPLQLRHRNSALPTLTEGPPVLLDILGQVLASEGEVIRAESGGEHVVDL